MRLRLGPRRENLPVGGVQPRLAHDLAIHRCCLLRPSRESYRIGQVEDAEDVAGLEGQSLPESRLRLAVAAQVHLGRSQIRHLSGSGVALDQARVEGDGTVQIAM